MDPLYQENILDHYKHPHNRRFMEGADKVQKGRNASCGDDLVLYLKIEHEANCSRAASSETCCDWKLADISFEGFGCAISQSGASMLTDHVKGMTRGALATLVPSLMTELYGVEVGVQREKCAMLSFSTLQSALGNSGQR